MPAHPDAPRARTEGAAHSRPRLQELLASLRLDVTYERAAGDHLYYRDSADREVEVLDMVGGFGSLLLGHAHPVLVAEAQRLLTTGRPIHAQGANRPYAQLLAAALSARAGGEYAVVFGNSGAEGVEAALKHAMLATGRRTFIAVEGAFHGKTLGALQLTHNAFYREAFALSGPRVLHVAPDEIHALERAFEQADSDVAGFIFEPVLGEGGVRPLSPEFVRAAAALCRSHGAFLIADECQTGLGRTGSFLASHALGVEPDCIVLAKALGGGIAKISACLVARERYHHGFDLRHTSTFADDDYSCAIALKTLELIDEELLSCVRAKGDSLLDGLRALQEDWPDVVRDVRGTGLMLGVEFQPIGPDAEGFVLRYVSSRDQLVKLLTGYLLREHRIRVMPTLSDPFTLRLQPSALLRDTEAERFLHALEDVCAKLRTNDCAGLTRFLGQSAVGATRSAPVVPGEPDGFFAFAGSRFSKRRQDQPRRRVAWLCHMVDSEDLVAFEPGLAALPASERETMLGMMAGTAAPVVMSSVDIRSRTGDSVRLECILLPITSSWISARLADGELRLARGLVQQGVDLASELGCSLLSLGQFTSIITANGTRLDAGDIGLTSGNTYTVGLAIDALDRAMRARRLDTESATLAVVGAAGNIARTCAELLAPRFRRTVLIGSNRPGAETRLGALAEQLQGDAVRVDDDPAAVGTADVVVSAPNTATAILHPADFRPHAIVCDLSVPPSVHADTTQQRPDVLLMKGGVARLPCGEDLELPGFPLPRGQTFACMAEGILLGLEGVSNREFTGALHPERVLQVGRMARRHGFELAEYKTACVLGSEPRSDPEETIAKRRHHTTS